MLVLSRRAGERLCIGQDVEITVLRVRGQEVQLGVTAPPHVPVHRLEIYQRLVNNGELPPSSSPACEGGP